MTVKKSAGTKKTAAAARHAAPEHAAADSAMPQDAAPEPMAQDAAPAKVEPAKVWALPAAMLMLVVASGGLWMAVRESSNTSQAATPAVEATLAPDRKAPKAAATTAAAPAASNDAAKPADAADAKIVSVTGCLQQADRGFVLKDTEGADAPKSRSWKSGFMRRSNSAIALSDTKSSTRFAEHVGERVTVTGPMTDRAMRVTSMKRIAATCE